jgi:preprotein translocase subunit SecD
MRDEMRAGRNVAQSVDRGFKSAFRTIIAADFTSLIGAAVLYFLTVGSVRGFALFLLISTSLDLIVAWAFTRPIVTLIAERQMKRNGFVSGAGSGPSKLTPSGGRLVPGSATQGAQL